MKYIRITICLLFLGFQLRAQNKLESTGYAGVGTTTPIYPLTIATPGVAWTSFGVTKNIRLFANEGNQDGGGIAVSDDGGFFDWNDGYVTYEPLCCGAGLRVRRSNFIVDENIGIGTTDTKGYKLAVNGDAIFTMVKVKPVGNWPDYVFRATYSLRPLNELEQYIQQHHHLPEVSSADEVERDGLDVGGNQAVLLKKIEELTLYIIDQNKQLQQLKSEVIQLKKQKLQQR
jgi:hypothetical protein